MLYATTCQSPVGGLTLVSDGLSLIGLWLAGQKYHGGGLLEKATESAKVPVFRETKKWLDRYFAGGRPEASELPLAPAGGEFRRRVWDLLLSIPYGGVISYGEMAKRLAAKAGGKRASPRAVGGAVGHNPISIIIPCHRVIGANGSLTGYAGGLAAKMRLLELEGVDMSGLFVPEFGTAL